MSSTDIRAPLLRVKRALRRYSILPITDPESPSLVSYVVGAPVPGSWWGHPSGGLIYAVGEALDTDPEVLVVRLWRGKLTLVHARLWPALVRVGRSHAAWQMVGMREVERLLLAHVDRETVVRGDRLPPDLPEGLPGFRAALRGLERRMLVLTRSVHTSTGAHALEAESWTGWRARLGVPAYRRSVASAQTMIELAAARLIPGDDPRKSLPWGRRGR